MDKICAIILAKNEEMSIARAVGGAKLVTPDVFVVDSRSNDLTARIARQSGAEVIDFDWNGRYPKKKQWAMNYLASRNFGWFLMLDADELVTPALAKEIAAADVSASAFQVPLEYHWRGHILRHGQRVYKTVLTRAGHAVYPDVDDLDLPGITEVEGHYQPSVRGRVASLQAALVHDDLDPLTSWYSRHNRYSDWEAHLRVDPERRRNVRRARSWKGRVLDRLPLKPASVFLFSYIVQRGFLDGRPGFEYAMSLAFYQFMISVKLREIQEPRPEVVDRYQGSA